MFEQETSNIPATIQTKRNYGNSRLSYLDLEINIRNRKFTTAVSISEMVLVFIIL